MRELEFKRGTWHHHVAKLGDFHCSDGRTDICSYTSAFLQGIVWLLIAVVVSCFFIYGAVDLVMFAFSDEDVMGITSFMFLLVLAIVGTVSAFFGILVGCVWATELLMERRTIHDNFVVEAWRSLKDKTCVRVVLK